MVQKWEYRTVQAPDLEGEGFVDRLNELGQEGWELAGCREGLYIFKRPVVEEVAWPVTVCYGVPLV